MAIGSRYQVLNTNLENSGGQTSIQSTSTMDAQTLDVTIKNARLVDSSSISPPRT